MRYWIFMLFLFTVIVFSRVAKAPEAERPVKMEVTETEFHDTTTWIRLSDSLNQITKR